jgi:hypothetical protein
MSQPTSQTIPVPSALTMKRLGYIRLLHGQAVEQSHQPAPLNFTSARVPRRA